VHFKKIWIAVPYLWLIAFFAIPFVYLFKISLSEVIFAVPPISQLVAFVSPGKLTVHIDFSHYIALFSDIFYLSGFISSLIMAAMTTFACLILGYGMAYGLIKLPKHLRVIGLMLIMVPFSTSFLIRVYAWIILLNQEGIINGWLMHLGVITAPLPLLYNDCSVLIGLVYCYLPFMILPIYTMLDKIDLSYLEAAADLGASPLRRFYQITLPLSMPGILAGCILVFVPVTGEFVIPELLGGPDTLMIGRIMWMEFFNNRDWPLAAALAVVMLLIFVIPIMGLQRWQQKKGGNV
jgi:putrescine transport system permease protein